MSPYPNLHAVKKILVVKLRHLGDVLLTTPIFHTLRRAFSKAEIDACVYREASPILEGHPAISQLFCVDRAWKEERLWSRLRCECSLLWSIRQRGYDLVLNLTEGDRGVIAARFSGAKIRVGFAPKGGWQKRQLTHIAKVPSAPRHTVEKGFDLLRRIGIFPQPEEGELFFAISEAARAMVKTQIGNRPFVLIHPTSRWKFKCLPVNTMRYLVQELIARGEQVVLTSGPDPVEIEMVAEIAQGLHVINLAGALSLKELGAVIEASQLLICVDSLPLHLASALKKPVVTFFGPTSEITWGPWRNPYAHVVTSPFSCRPCYMDGCGGSKRSECLYSLSLDHILQVVLQNLNSAPK